MPKATDTDLNKFEERNIIFTGNDDCPECDTTIDVEYDTGAIDEDGLTGLSEGDLTTEVTCPECGHVWESVFTGWTNYGDA